MKLKNMLKDKELLLTVFAQLCQFLSSILLLKLLTSTMTMSSYGELSLLLSCSALILALPFTALQQGFFRYRTIYVKEEKGTLHITSMVLGISVVVAFYIIFSLFYIAFIEHESYIKDYYAIFAVFIVTEIFKIHFRMIVNADRDKVRYALSIIFEFSIKILLCSFFSVNYSINTADVFLIYAVANVISILVSLYKSGLTIAIKKYDNLMVYSVWRKVVIFSTPMMVWALFGWFRDSALRWFVEDNYSVNEVAIFTALSTVALVVPTALQSLLSVYIVPQLYSSVGSSNEKEVHNKFKKLMAFVYIAGVFGLVFFYYFHNVIIRLISDEKYSEFSHMLPVMYLGSFLFNCAMLKANVLLAHFKQNSLIFPNLVSGVSVAVYGYFIMPYIQFSYVAYGYSIPYLLYFIITTLLVRRFTAKIC